MGGEEHTHAYYAANIVSRTVSEFLTDTWEGWFEGSEELVQRLKRRITEGLSSFAERNGICPDPRFRGSVFRTLPTTLATFVYRSDGNVMDVVCIRAGDSRCYCLDADGLHLLSADEVPGADEMDPHGDAMHDAVSLSGDFKLDCRMFRLKVPCFVFAATDGVFSYFDSPMHFEVALVPSSPECADYVSHLGRTVSDRHFDDCSLAGVMEGFSSVADFTSTLSRRRAELHSGLVSGAPTSVRLSLETKELRSAATGTDTSDLKAEIARLRERYSEELLRIWHMYRKGYLQYLGDQLEMVPAAERETDIQLVGTTGSKYGIVGNWTCCGPYYHLCSDKLQEVFARRFDPNEYGMYRKCIGMLDLEENPRPGLQRPHEIVYDAPTGIVFELYGPGRGHVSFSNAFACDKTHKLDMFRMLLISLDELYDAGLSHGAVEEPSVTLNVTMFPLFRNYLLVSEATDDQRRSDILGLAKLMHLAVTGRRFDSLEKVDIRVARAEKDGDAVKAGLLKLISEILADPSGFDTEHIMGRLRFITATNRDRTATSEKYTFLPSEHHAVDRLSCGLCQCARCTGGSQRLPYCGIHLELRHTRDTERDGALSFTDGFADNTYDLVGGPQIEPVDPIPIEVL